ncbi:MAG: DNA polymerase IV, partial [Myxococcales bacterium]|nr:DNA polymerase IV [Myxococcales bacterium]
MRAILHADMDAFYASVEQRDDPSLRGKPVIVGGTGNRGVVAAASYEARRFGVHSAMPTVEARRLCPDGVYLRGRMKAYAAESRRIFEVFRRFTPAVEGLSLDEAFLDVTGTERLFGPPAEVGRLLREAVRQKTGLAVSVGIAPVKMVAKIASDVAKPDGLLEVPPGGVRAFLDPLPVGRIWGVGPVAQRRLEALGLETVGDLARADVGRLEQALGRWGLEVARLARGEDVREVEPYREAISYSEENTFVSDVSDRMLLESTLIAHAESVARRLRRDGLAARTVLLKLKLGRRREAGPRGYPIYTRRTTLREPTDDGAVLSAHASQLLKQFGLEEPIRLIGVGATNLVQAEAEQFDFFGASNERGDRKRLNRALDEIHDRYGGDAVKHG